MRNIRDSLKVSSLYWSLQGAGTVQSSSAVHRDVRYVWRRESERHGERSLAICIAATSRVHALSGKT